MAAAPHKQVLICCPQGEIVVAAKAEVVTVRGEVVRFQAMLATMLKLFPNPALPDQSCLQGV